MGKFDGVAILTDLDGTFLSSCSGMVARNIEAITYFKREGGRFSLATGRMHYNLDRLVADVSRLTNAPSILCNGTYLYDFSKDEIIAENFMNPDLSLRAAKRVITAFSDVHVRISRREGYLLSAGDAFSVKELDGYGIEQYEVLPLDEWSGDRWYKMVISGAAECVNAVESALMREFPDVFEYNRSRNTTLEMQMRGTTKASLVGAYRDFLSKKGERRRLYMCGDYENDRAILSAADVAVCPANALSEIKALCDLCLGSNNEGVIADLIERLDGEN